MSKIIFPFGLVVCVGQACNLRCVDCGNLAPEADQFSKVYSLEGIIESLNLLKDIIEPIECLQIQGGEPFLYCKLESLVEWILESNMADHLLIATNGLFVPQGGVDYLKNDKVMVRISNYQVDNKQSIETEYILKNQGINVNRYDFATDNGDWFYTGRKNDIYDDLSGERAEHIFNRCKFNICLTLEDQKLAYCSRAINSEKVIGFKSGKYDYVYVVQENNNLEEELRNYISKPHHMEACKYCYGTEKICKAGKQPDQ